MSIENRFKKLFNNFIRVKINDKCYVITLWIMHSKVMTRSSPLRKIKLIAIVNWIFHASDFLGLFMMLFKYDLILSRYSLIDRVLFLLPFLLPSYFNIIVVPKVTCSCWFVTVLLFFMLKQVPNISNYSVFDCFILFFQSRKISYIFSYVVSHFFYLFQALDFSSYTFSSYPL